MGKTIIYDKKPIVVSNEVAEFLETDRKRQAAQERSDRRHISKSSSETVSGPYYSPYTSDVETVVFKNLMLENLHHALGALPPKERKLIERYYFDGNTMERMPRFYDVNATRHITLSHASENRIQRKNTLKIAPKHDIIRRGLERFSLPAEWQEMVFLSPYGNQII